MSNRYIIGLGNYSMGDDSIGLRIVEHIVDKGLEDGFIAMEAGNDGMRALTCFEEDTSRILIVDCGKMDREPGEYVIFDPSEAVSKKIVGNISTHEGDILRLIAFAGQMDLHIPEIKVLAIEPACTDMSMTLSLELQERFEEYIVAALREIQL